jgi:NAD+ synthase (glutamine-hydrolysing)
VVPAPQPSRPALLLDALVLGLRDYMRKSGFRDCVLGVSGGIDSALACYIAARAVGPEHVHALLMPSRHSSEHSVNDARLLAANLGVDAEVIPIDAIHRAYEGTAVVGADLASQPGGLADQNIQARIRGALVMIRSNRYGWLALATGNKSELAVGYCTLYGDMCGGLAVISDLPKTMVYSLSRIANSRHEYAIPESVFEKAPSAELRPDQKDSDSLPPYDILDSILRLYIEENHGTSDVAAELALPIELVRDVVRKVDRNEYKRQQAAPGLKVTSKAFGVGRRLPVAQRYSEYE